jgi:hypothetical protein
MKNNLIFFTLLAASLTITSCSTTGSATGSSKKMANPFGEKPSCSTTESGDKSSCNTTGKGAKRIADPAGDEPYWDSSSNVGKQ